MKKSSWRKKISGVSKRIGGKIKSTNWRVLGRKVRNTLSDIHSGIQDAAGVVAPYSAAVAAGATALGQPEVAAPATAVTAAALALKKRR